MAKPRLNEDAFWERGIPNDVDLVFLRDFTARFIPDNIRALYESVQMFKRARSWAAMGTFLWGDDVTGRATAGAAIDAARAGKKVTVLIDALDIGKPGYRALFSAMAKEGVEVLLFHELLKYPLRANQRFHDKAQMNDLPDGRIQLKIGGRNAMDHYNLGNQTLDLDVLMTLSKENGKAVYDLQFGSPLEQGSVTRLKIDSSYGDAEHAVKMHEIREAQELTKYFFEKEMPRNTIEFKEVHVKRGFYARNRAGRHTATKVIESMIRFAKTHVTMANAYLIPNRKQAGIIERSLDFGVTHAYFTNFFDSTEHWGVVHMMMWKLNRALKKGLGLFTRVFGEVHAKGIVMDNQWVGIGSVNFDDRSRISDEQNLAGLDSPEMAAQFENSLVQEMRAGQFKKQIGGWKGLVDYCKKLLISPVTRWL